MNLLNWVLRKSGLDILSAKYSYGNDPVLGFTSTRKHAEKWVKSTCGYCSVGCGMELGVRDGKVVSVRGDPDHPVNLGKLCPKGLSEHYALDAEDRAKFPLLRKNGKLVTRQLGGSADCDGRSLLAPCSANMAISRWASSAPANCLPKNSMRFGKAGATWFWNQ